MGTKAFHGNEMPKFEQKFLTPGRYPDGDGFIDLTTEDLAEYVEGTREMLAGGLGVQVIKKHALAGSDEGGAQDGKPESEDGIGWLEDVVQGSDGAVTAIYDVPLKADAERFGKVDRFTSAELRRSHTDGKGRKYGKHFAHISLTPRPRDPDQGAIKPVESAQFCYQFSLDDRVDPMPISKQAKEKSKRAAAKKLADAKKAKQFSDHTDDGKLEKVDKDEDNTDHEDDKDIAAKIGMVKEMLAVIGVEIPADSDDPVSFLDQLIGALSAMADTGGKEEAAELEEVSPEVAQFQNQINSLKGQLNQANREKLAGLIASAKLPPALAEPLLKRANAVQFSDDGRQRAILTVSEVVDLFTAAIPENLQFSEDGQPVIADHPKVGYFDPPTEDGQLSPEAGAAESKAMLAELGVPVKETA